MLYNIVMKIMIKKYLNIKFIIYRGFFLKVLENILEGFKKVVKLFFFGIEIDIYLIFDQVVIIYYDDNLIRFVNIDLNINEISYEVISIFKFKDIYKIFLFDVYIDICKIYYKEVIIELKLKFSLD